MSFTGTLSGGFKFLKNAPMQCDINIKVSSSLKLCQIKQSLTVNLIFSILYTFFFPVVLSKSEKIY